MTYFQTNDTKCCTAARTTLLICIHLYCRSSRQKKCKMSSLKKAEDNESTVSIQNEQLSVPPHRTGPQIIVLAL